MKRLKNFLIYLRCFFLSLTPSGRSVLMYEEAYKNINEANTITELEKRILAREINNFINENLAKRILTASQKELLVLDKFGKKMKLAGFRLDPVTKRLISA